MGLALDKYLGTGIQSSMESSDYSIPNYYAVQRSFQSPPEDARRSWSSHSQVVSLGPTHLIASAGQPRVPLGQDAFHP